MPEIWSEALEAARNISNESHRAWALSSLAPQLPENLLPEALEAARNIRDESYRAKALSSLAPQLPEIWSEALETARNISDGFYRAEILSSLAPQLPENLLKEALKIVRNMKEESKRAEGLNTLVSNIHKMFNSFPYDFWCELIHSLASLKRGELLKQISKNSQIIKELGGSKTFGEIVDAITDVGRWFP